MHVEYTFDFFIIFTDETDIETNPLDVAFDDVAEIIRFIRSLNKLSKEYNSSASFILETALRVNCLKLRFWFCILHVFFSSAIDTLKLLVIAIGAGIGVWGVINLLEGYAMKTPAPMLMYDREAKIKLLTAMPIFRNFLLTTKKEKTILYLSNKYTYYRKYNRGLTNGNYYK